ncbi:MULTISPECIES: hypothetical protein [Weeksellaceae]|uniref:CD-NTase associated protein 4-like DNA endonuclease domain-containing protein n=1 Tax=Moheibacter sediminis TaxID=1434700 RepID=A0A1W1YKK8_9FLAO|nr:MULTISPECIES: hypothetical protein [Weeksellaceae]AQX84259.1 hypothetical protein AYC65_04160 [Elizabethkingia bruuniana]KUY28438.1 hypothetical protein ATB97_16155 [Elizabethkingia bruuniana]OPB64678.1 hypothetical protein BAY12_07800 [Elizabethkingia bruuniana]SMC36770.1 hypothetical protein SAMN06296427_101499 [Moheibacter sediminis]
MNETLDNDSTKKQLGFEYQKLVALEYCLNAKNGEHVYIECFGDVQYGTESIEVKHHEGESNLTSNSVDVWKTLKNLVVEYEKLKSNDKFILHTTQNVPSDSIFHDWSQLTKTVKYKKLKDHAISATSKPFKDVIFDAKTISKTDFLRILDKFFINSGEPKVDEILAQLKEHTTFKLIDDKLRSSAIGVLQQWIIEKAIDDSNKWEINITDFNSDMRFSLSKFTKDHIPFPSIKEPGQHDSDLTKGYKFIEKLNAISIKKNDLHQAFQDYVRSEEAYEEILKINPTLKDNIIVYEAEINSAIQTEKSAASYHLSDESFKDNSHIKKSQEVYFKCITNTHSEISGFNGTQRFFRNGRIQNINETSDFEWLYKETDL